MTEKETEIFKGVLKKNGIPCREKPRTKEELANLIFIYNEKKETLEIKSKDHILTKDETFIPTPGLCETYLTTESEK